MGIESPTVDKTIPLGETIPIGSGSAERTWIELIKHAAENYRVGLGLWGMRWDRRSPWRLANLKYFIHFLSLLREGLEKEVLGEVWPVLVCAGWEQISILPPLTRSASTGRKSGPVWLFYQRALYRLCRKPQGLSFLGMGAANGRSEFTEEEYNALVQLFARLKDKRKEERLIARSSSYLNVFWKKKYTRSGRAGRSG